jgi:hypothetical protein
MALARAVLAVPGRSRAYLADRRAVATRRLVFWRQRVACRAPSSTIRVLAVLAVLASAGIFQRLVVLGIQVGCMAVAVVALAHFWGLGATVAHLAAAA